MKEVEILLLPNCNFCENNFRKVKAEFDGKVKGVSYWAYMCDDCFREYGVGLGTGMGQRLILVKKEN